MTKTVNELLAGIEQSNPAQYKIAISVRSLVKKNIKPITEEVKYGGILFSSGVQFCGVFVYSGHVSLEFGHGARMPDPIGVLEGKGKGRRHIKICSLTDIKTKRISDYIPLALEASQCNA